MKNTLGILGAMFVLAGGVFLLQGINILPGSFMTGSPRWAVIGCFLITVGIGLFIWANRRR